MAHAFLYVTNPVSVIQRCIKVPYSRKTAQRLLRSFRRKAECVESGSGVFQAYVCDICHQYHLGHR